MRWRVLQAVKESSYAHVCASGDTVLVVTSTRSHVKRRTTESLAVTTMKAVQISMREATTESFAVRIRLASLPLTWFRVGSHCRWTSKAMCDGGASCGLLWDSCATKQTSLVCTYQSINRAFMHLHRA